MTDGAAHGIRSKAAESRVRRVTGSLRTDLIDRPTKRRAGVWRRAIRREVSRIRDRQHLVAILLLAVVGGVFAAGLIARGEAAGADARAYWAGVRIWLNGGDPYHPAAPFLPYVYAPWLLPAFAPWALLPWDVAWFVWRGALILVLFWTIHWAYVRRPLATAVSLTALSFPIAANLDTGNVTLVLTFLLWGTQFAGARVAGLFWALATWIKWLPAVLIVILRPRARAWGLAWLLAAILLSLAMLPLTIVQFQALFGFGGRPIRLDYLVLIWAAVPWLWRHPAPLWWLQPSARAGALRNVRGQAVAWRTRWQADPEAAAAGARHEVGQWVRSFLGLQA